jgi:hypothetical protein
MLEAEVLEAGWVVAKIAVILLMGLYLVFATVIVRQVHLMTKTLEIGLESPLRLVALLHLIFAVIVFLVALFYL